MNFSRYFPVYLLLYSTLLLGSDGSFQRRGPELSFEPNLGQAEQDARFVSSSADGTIYLLDSGMKSFFGRFGSGTSVQMNLAGDRRCGKMSAEDATGGVSNYYPSSDRSTWVEKVPRYRRVRCREIYSGVDLVYHGREGRLEYDFEISPGGRVEDIELEFSGEQSLGLGSDGSLLIHSGQHNVSFRAPRAYQADKDINVAFRIVDEHHAAFEVGKYDHQKLLVIDPVVEYTYVIGLDDYFEPSEVGGVTVNSAGEMIITGMTLTHIFPNTGSSVPYLSSGTFFITKLNASGDGVVYSTLLAGGSGKAIALDSSGNAYVTGLAFDPLFATTSTSLGICTSPCNTGFAAKFSSNGTLQFSTLLSASGVMPRAIAISSNGEPVITGVAGDSLSMVSPYQACTSQCVTPFLAKLNTSGTGYVFSTHFGTSGDASGLGIDSSGNIYVSGIGSVPLVDEWESTGSLFISEFSPDGQNLIASKYFGNAYQWGQNAVGGLVVGTDGSVYVSGTTNTGDFPFTLNAYRPQRIPAAYASGRYNMFAAGFTPGLSNVKFSTYLGQGHVNAMTIDSSNRIYVAGEYAAEPLILKDAVVSDLGHGGFYVSLDSNGALVQASEFGGHNETQIPAGIAVDPNFNIYLASIPNPDYSVQVDDMVDPVHVGTGVAYLRELAMGFSGMNGFAISAAKISPTNRPQVSMSYFQRYLALRNASSVILNLSSIKWNGTPLTTGDCGATLAAGTSCILSILTLDPSGQLSITSNAQPSVQTFNPGIPLLASNLLHLHFQPAAMFFPPQQMNTTSAPQQLKITNYQPIAVSIGPILASGSVSQTNNCPSSLAPRGSCTVTLTVHPTTDAAGGGQIYVDPVNQYGVGIEAFPNSAILPSMPGASFGNTAVGKSSLIRTVNLHNAGASTLTGLTATIEGDSSFIIAGTTCTASLASHAECGVGVQYVPSKNGHSTATLKLVSGNQTAQVQLNANGFIPSAMKMEPLEMTFYSTVIGKQSYQQTVTLTNSASTPIAVTGIQFARADYSQTNTCQSSINPGGTCTISVSITPQDIGDRSTTMTITFDSALTQQLSISSNADFPLTVGPTAMDFGTASVGGQSAPIYLSLANNQSSPVEYSITINGDDFLVPEYYCRNPMPAYNACGLVTVFKPKSAGFHQGTLKVAFPGVTQQYVVALAGTGVEVVVRPTRPGRTGRPPASRPATPHAVETATAESYLPPLKQTPNEATSARRSSVSKTVGQIGANMVEIESVQVSSRLAGIVKAVDGSPLAAVEVLEVGSDWRTIIRSTTTDENGRWSFPALSESQVHFLRFFSNTSYFSEVRAKVKVDKKSRRDLEVKLSSLAQ